MAEKKNKKQQQHRFNKKKSRHLWGVFRSERAVELSPTFQRLLENVTVKDEMPPSTPLPHPTPPVPYRLPAPRAPLPEVSVFTPISIPRSQTTGNRLE